MHYRRKGSFGLSPARSKTRTRWSGVLLFVFTLLLLSYRFNLIVFILPHPINASLAQTSCPVVPPHPPIVSYGQNTFDWRKVEQYHPVEELNELPLTPVRRHPRVQHEFSHVSLPQEEIILRKTRQAMVKAAFEKLWKGYRNHFPGQITSSPASNKTNQVFAGRTAVLMDSLDILRIMDMQEDVSEVTKIILDINFAPEEGEINVAQISTRQLGGLLAAYDLTGCRDGRLLQKAMELGDMLYLAFDTANQTPITRWDAWKALDGEKQEFAEQTSVAELASFDLEFTRLSQLTGDMRYFDAVTRVTNLLALKQNDTKVPGLWPMYVDLNTLDMGTSTVFSLDATSNSAYDSFIKLFQCLGHSRETSRYKTVYTQAVESMVKHILFRPITPSNADILVPTTTSVYKTGSIVGDHSVQHAACSLGAMLALGSKLLANTTHLAYAKRVTEACIWAYSNASNGAGIMPEYFTMLACANALPQNDNEDCSFDPGVWPEQVAPGFETVTDGRTVVRPQAIESVFYMYRVTGEERYQKVAWEMWQSVEKLLNNVDAETTGNEPGEESGLMFSLSVHTLKYFYLIFSEPDFMSLDEWVYTTGGHPLRIPI